MFRFAAVLLAMSQASIASKACIAGRYDLPPEMASALRPYATCLTLASAGSRLGTEINGSTTLVGGFSKEACGAVRAKAKADAEFDLSMQRPGTGGHAAKVERELAAIEAFADRARGKTSIAITPSGEASPQLPACPAPTR